MIKGRQLIPILLDFSQTSDINDKSDKSWI